MKVIDNDLLNEFRHAGICEFCLRRVTNREPHHIIGRGMGGGRRMDVRINLISLCAEFSGGAHCHTLVHVGRIGREKLLAVVARREGLSVDALERELHRLRRL